MSNCILWNGVDEKKNCGSCSKWNVSCCSEEHILKDLGKIREIKDTDALFATFEPRGLFYKTVNKSLYIGIDNLTGDAWTEEFNTLENCVKWLLREE